MGREVVMIWPATVKLDAGFPCGLVSWQDFVEGWMLEDLRRPLGKKKVICGCVEIVKGFTLYSVSTRSYIVWH